MQPATAIRPDEAAKPAPRGRRATIVVLCTAELAPCTCPDYCERDHDRD